jgi:cytochrome P450
MTVICELVGVPESDRDTVRGWTETITPAQFTAPEAFVAAVTGLVGYLRELIAERRLRPADDLLSTLVAVRDEGDQLTEDELTSMVWLLILAGHETTVNLIGNGTRALLSHPEQLARLRAEPELMAGAVDELLRFDDPADLDVGRQQNAHLAFGYGVHHCLGAPLARLEGQIALSTLLARFPRLRLAVPPDQLTRSPNPAMHGLTSLPVVLG